MELPHGARMLYWRAYIHLYFSTCLEDTEQWSTLPSERMGEASPEQLSESVAATRITHEEESREPAHGNKGIAGT